MIFSKVREVTAQTSIEACICLGVVLIVGIMTVAFILSGLGTLLATRWAASHSRCIAMGNNQEACTRQTSRELSSFFAFKKIEVHTRIWQDIIHTDIQAELVSQIPIRGAYD